MIIKYIKPYWRLEDAINNRHVLFIFADNDEKKGKSGYAIVRGQINAIGIPCSKLSKIDNNYFYSDLDFEDNKEKFDISLHHIHKEAEKYKEIWFPEHLISEITFYTAPKSFAYLDQRLRSLKEVLSK